MAGQDEKESKGFFRRLFRFAFLAAAVGTVVAAIRRRRGRHRDDDEWREIPPTPPSA